MRRAAGATGVFPVGTPRLHLVDEVLQLAAAQPDAPQPEGDA
jgi:hypothetical protein